MPRRCPEFESGKAGAEAAQPKRLGDAGGSQNLWLPDAGRFSYFEREQRMWILGLFPFALQALAMVFDEGYFHVRRGLPKWERIGHPIDTCSVIACMGFVLFVPFSTTALIGYIVLAAFSCILVTKDEFVHKDHCPASENWLHALLFTLHPITLTCAGFIWPVVQGFDVTPWIARWLDNREALHQFLYMQFGTMILFTLYQIVFWNFIWKDKPVLRQ